MGLESKSCSGGGMLHVLSFDAMPFQQWGQVKDGFRFILDSVKLEDPIKKDGI
jgi:hypothetical protein